MALTARVVSLPSHEGRKSIALAATDYRLLSQWTVCKLHPGGLAVAIERTAMLSRAGGVVGAMHRKSSLAATAAAKQTDSK